MVVVQQSFINAITKRACIEDIVKRKEKYIINYPERYNRGVPGQIFTTRFHQAELSIRNLYNVRVIIIIKIIHLHSGRNDFSCKPFWSHRNERTLGSNRLVAAAYIIPYYVTSPNTKAYHNIIVCTSEVDRSFLVGWKRRVSREIIIITMHCNDYSCM